MYNFTPEQKLAIAKRFANHAKENTRRILKASGVKFKEYDHKRQTKVDKIRIGYMSYDFADHPLAHLMASIFKMHDRKKFEVIAFSLRKNDGSEWRIKIEQHCDEFYEINENMGSQELANFVYEKNIHIFVNLNGWTSGHRTDVFSLRPAPIQVSYMGFCSSIGADFIDYIVTDEIASPAECVKRFYTEKAIFMPNNYFVTDYKQSSLYCLLDDS